jgi:type I restriction enzyme S subunit
MEKLKRKTRVEQGRNKPSIRFPEFKDEWQHTKLSELLSEAKKRNEDLKYGKDEVLSVSGELGIVNQIEHLGRSYAGASVHNYHVVETADIVYTKSPLKANPFGIIKLNKGKAGIVSTLYAVYKVNSKTCYGPWLDYYFSLDTNTNRYLRPLVKKGAKNDMKINNAYVLHDRIFVPTIPEQKRISSFLDALDNKISALKKKKELLESYKTGITQLLFTRKIRFKDSNNLNFKNWDKFKLGKIIEEYKENSVIENQHPVLTSSNKGLVLQTDYYDNNRITEKSNLGFNIIPSSYITYRSRSDNKRFTFNVNDFDFKGLISTYYPVFKLIEGSNKFLIEYLNYNWKYIGIYGVGTSQAVLSFNTLKTIEINIPCIEEQTKIANFLSNLDEKINRTENQIQETIQYRKGLLQKMFI